MRGGVHGVEVEVAGVCHDLENCWGLRQDFAH